MKIAHICLEQYSDGWTYQENLLSKFHKKMGFEVVIITSMYCYAEGKLVEDSKNEFTDVNGVRVLRLKKKSDGLMEKVPTFLNFYKMLEAEKPDIIFSHGCQYKDVVKVVKYVKKHANVQLFVDNHADFSNSATNFLSKEILHKIIWRHYAQILLPYTKKFWGVMPARVDFMVDLYKLPKEKCDLLVMGADDDLVEKSSYESENNALRDRYKISKDDFLIVTGGKIDEAKIQTELLMKAVLNLDEPNVKLLFFGSIEEKIKSRIMSLVDKKKVIYAGWITPDQSYDYFEIADLVVFPGRHSVFWEQAAGQGKPLLVKEWAGTKHIDVGGNVEFIENDSVVEMERKLSNILQDKAKYQNMKNVASTIAKKYFSYRQIAQRSIEN